MVFRPYDVTFPGTVAHPTVSLLGAMPYNMPLRPQGSETESNQVARRREE